MKKTISILFILSWFIAPAQTVFLDSAGKKVSFDEAYRTPSKIYFISVESDIVSEPVIRNFPGLKKLHIKNDKGNTFLRNVKDLPQLEELIIEMTDGDSVPSAIWSYTSLKRLIIRNAAFLKFENNLAALTKLEELRFVYCNQFQGFPQQLLFEQLRILEISFTYRGKESFTFDGISGLKNLQYLKLSGANLNASLFDEIYQLTKLQFLDLSSNQLKKIPVTIFQLKNLEVLHFGNNQIVMLPGEIGKLQQLRILDLHNNKLKRLPESMGNLKNLEQLILHHNDALIQLPVSVSGLCSLKFIKLYKCDRLDYKNAFKYLGQCAALDSMEISLSGGIPATMSHLTHLKSLVLDVAATDFNWTSALSLSQLNQLTRLKIYSRGIDLPVLLSSLKSLPLKYLDLSSCELTQIPAEIELVKNLEYLSLHNNKISRVHENIARLDKLKYLDLQSQKTVSGTGEQKVTTYHLHEIPETIVEIRSLRNLLLLYTGIPEEKIAILQEKMPWCRIQY